LAVSAISTRDIPESDASDAPSGTALVLDGGAATASAERGLHGLRRRRTWPKSPLGDPRDENVHVDQIVFKLADNVGAHVSGGRLTRDAEPRSSADRDRARFLGADPSLADDAISSLISALGADRSIQLQAIVERSATFDAMRAEGERRVDHELADLSAFAVLQLPSSDRASSERWLRVLRESPIVEFAYLQPRSTPPQARCTDQAPPTVGVPTTVDQGPRAAIQAVLAGLPGAQLPAISNTFSGHDVAFARTVPGGSGLNIPIYDVEQGFYANHEKLPAIATITGTNSAWFDHGTAMLGIMVGCNTPYGGFVGYSDQATAYFASQNPNGVAAAINTSVGHLAAVPGRKVILLEAQSQRGDSVGCGLPVTCACSFVPTEVAPADFAAIQLATALGAVVVEAAGNGGRLLDSIGIIGRPYNDPNNSRAIMVGHVTPGVDATGRHLVGCDSNAGSRNDLSAWGTRISSAGYGICPTCQPNGSDVNQWYTNNTGSTSGASAVVAASLAAVMGMTRAAGGESPSRTANHYRGLLRRTAIPESTALGTAPRTAGPTVHLGMAANVFAARALGDDSTRTFNTVISGARTQSILWAASRNSSGAQQFNRFEGGAWDGWVSLPSASPSIQQVHLVDATSSVGRVEAWAVDVLGNLLVSRRTDLTPSGSFSAWALSDVQEDIMYLTPVAAFAGYVDAFAVTYSGQLRWYYEAINGATMYAAPITPAVPKTLESRVVAVPNADRCDLFAIDSNHQLVHAWVDASGAFNGWTVVDAATTASSVDAVWHQGQIFVAARYASSRLFSRYDPGTNTFSTQIDTNGFSASALAIYLFAFEGDDSAPSTITAVEKHSSGAALRSRVVYASGTWYLSQDTYTNWAESNSVRMARVPFQNGLNIALFVGADGRAMGRVIDPIFPRLF
jgi:hypothetical protein